MSQIEANMSRRKLLTIYERFDGWARAFEFACNKGCSSCCTGSVSMTILEGELIADYIRTEKPELLDTLRNLPQSSLNPRTTNEFAEACLREEDEGEEGGWDMRPCVFLRDGCCAVYPVRPFMCRSFGSRVPCDREGEAEVAPLYLTLNTVVMQCIEHLDQGRPWGNMNAILRMAGQPGSGREKEQQACRISRSIPGFLLTPDEAEALEEHLQSLLKIVGVS